MKPTMESPLGLDALFRAYLNAKRFEKAVPELRDFHVLKRDLLSRLLLRDARFGTRGEWKDPVRRADDWEFNVQRDAVAGIAGRAIACAALHLSPFTTYLEGGPRPAERELRTRYLGQVRDKERELLAIYQALFADAVRFLFPDVDERTVTYQALVDLGLPEEEPDEYDFI